ncbi:MAG: hypothetical protein FWG63_01570 [Defluviitaleaceae bacterium]|nr:hypothetical protein [Defluviitaleaceae bacterium]
MAEKTKTLKVISVYEVAPNEYKTVVEMREFSVSIHFIDDRAFLADITAGAQ